MKDIDVVVEQEDDGRWVADVIGMPGVYAHGATQREATLRAVLLACLVLRELGAN